MERTVRWFLLLLMIGESLVGVNAASETAQNRGGQMQGTQGERKKMESKWVQMNQRNFKQEKETCRSRVQKESNMVR